MPYSIFSADAPSVAPFHPFANICPLPATAPVGGRLKVLISQSGTKVKTANLSGKQRNLSPRQFREMREMLAGLTPAERASLADPEFITEDEADLIWSDRAVSEPGKSIPAEEIFAEFGYTPRKRA